MRRLYFAGEFKDIIFMGNGSPGSTESNILKLQRLVDRCLTEIGGLQQTPMGAEHPSGDPDGWKKEYDAGWENVYDMVADIAMALTGKKICFEDDIEKIVAERIEDYEAQTMKDKEDDFEFDEEDDDDEEFEYEEHPAEVIGQLVVRALKDQRVRKFFKLAEKVASEAKKKYDAR